MHVAIPIKFWTLCYLSFSSENSLQKALIIGLDHSHFPSMLRD